MSDQTADLITHRIAQSIAVRAVTDLAARMADDAETDGDLIAAQLVAQAADHIDSDPRPPRVEAIA